MSEKGLERETEGISVGSREPVVADSSPKGAVSAAKLEKAVEGAETKGAGAASGGGHCRRRGDLEGRGQTASRCDDVSGGGGGAPLYH